MSFIVAQVDYDYPDRDIEKKIIEAAGGTLISAHLTKEDEIVEFAKDADGIIVQYAQITKSLMKRLPKLKVVSRYGIGIDNVDVKAAQELGIYVANNPQYCIDEVSDHAVAMIMTLHRQIASGTAQIKEGVWDYARLTPVKAARETLIGIVGFGNIGRRAAEKLKAIGFQCAAADPYVDDAVFEKCGVRRMSLEALMAESDCVTVHCALTDETKDLVSGEMIRRMKPGSYLVNTSRGPVVNLDDLMIALEEGRIRGAALDVLEEEPPASFDRIATHPSLLLTPHLAFYSDSSILELRSTITEQVVEVMEGKKPRFNLY